MGGVALANRMCRGHDRDPLIERHVLISEGLMMDPIQGGDLTADPMGSRYREVDLARVDVAQLIQIERGLMGEHAARTPWPQRRLHVSVEWSNREVMQAVQPVSASFQVPRSAMRINVIGWMPTARASCWVMKPY